MARCIVSIDMPVDDMSVDGIPGAAGLGSVAGAESGCAAVCAGGVTVAAGAAVAGIAGATAFAWSGAGRSRRSMAMSEGPMATRLGFIIAPPAAAAETAAVAFMAVLSTPPALDTARAAPISRPSAHTAKP